MTPSCSSDLRTERTRWRCEQSRGPGEPVAAQPSQNLHPVRACTEKAYFRFSLQVDEERIEDGHPVIYVVLLVTLGLLSIRKGHWLMFILGFFLPIFWFIGALMRPRLRVA